MRLLNEQLASRRLDLMDGVKAYDERGWVQVLPDPDEPARPPLRRGRDRRSSRTELAAEIDGVSRRSCRETSSSERTLEQASS